MDFNSLWKKYNSLGVLSDAELLYMIDELTTLDKAAVTKSTLLGELVITGINMELNRLKSMAAYRGIK